MDNWIAWYNTSVEALHLRGLNQWCVFNYPQCKAIRVGAALEVNVNSLPNLEEIMLCKRNVNVTVQDTPALHAVHNEGILFHALSSKESIHKENPTSSCKVKQKITKGMQNLVLTGKWQEVRLNNPELEQVYACGSKKIVFEQAPNLKLLALNVKAELKFTNPTEQLTPEQKIYQERQRFYYPAMSKETAQANYGDIFQFIKALYQTPYAFKGLELISDMQDFGLPAKQIWQWRNEFYKLNSRFADFGWAAYGTYPDWSISGNGKENIRFVVLDKEFKIWHDCYQASPESVQGFEFEHHKRNLPWIFKRLFEIAFLQDSPEAIKNIARENLDLCFETAESIFKIRRQAFESDTYLKDEVLPLFEKSKDKDIQKRLFNLIGRLSYYEEFLEVLPILHAALPGETRMHLLQISESPESWFRAFISFEELSRLNAGLTDEIVEGILINQVNNLDTDRPAREIRNELKMLAMADLSNFSYENKLDLSKSLFN